MTVHFKIVDRHSACLHYVEPLMALTEQIKQANGFPLLYPPNEELFIRRLDTNRHKIFTYDNQRLIGFSILEYLDQWPEYLSHLDYPPEQSAVLLITLLHPDHRRLGISKKMTEIRVNAAKTEGINYLFSTVHPDNIASIKNLQSQGMQMIEQRLMFEEQLLRNLMFLDLTGK